MAETPGTESDNRCLVSKQQNYNVEHSLLLFGNESQVSVLVKAGVGVCPLDVVPLNLITTLLARPSLKY